MSEPQSWFEYSRLMENASYEKVKSKMIDPLIRRTWLIFHQLYKNVYMNFIWNNLIL